MTAPAPWSAPAPVAAAAAWLGAALPDAVALYVFGSAAAGALRPDSDLDLALLPRAPLTAAARWDLAQRLASAVSRDVDLVDLLSASDVLRVQVLGHGQLLWERDATARAFFEARALAGYAHLNEERRDILDDFRARVAATQPEVRRG